MKDCIYEKICLNKETPIVFICFLCCNNIILWKQHVGQEPEVEWETTSWLWIASLHLLRILLGL